MEAKGSLWGALGLTSGAKTVIVLSSQNHAIYYVLATL